MKLTANKIYLAFIFANIFCKSIGLNSASTVYKLIMIIGLIGVLSGIVSRKYSCKEMIISMIMILSGIMTLLITKQYTFLITCITVIGIKRTEIDRLIRKICSVRTLCFMLIVSLALLNIIDRDKMEIWRNTAYISRYGMGYGHPNILHLTLFIVLTLNYYCNVQSKLDQKKFLLKAIVLNIFIYRYSSSRTGFFVLCILELLIIMHHFKIMNKIAIKLPAVTFCTFMGFTFLIPLLKNIGLLKGTSLLNGRIDYTYLYLTRYGYSLFGFNNSLSETGLILDNGYLRLLVETGIIGLLIWIYLNYGLMKRIERKGDWKLAIIVTCFYVYTFTESFSANVFMNYILFWGADELFNGNDNEVKVDVNNFYADIQ